MEPIKMAFPNYNLDLDFTLVLNRIRFLIFAFTLSLSLLGSMAWSRPSTAVQPSSEAVIRWAQENIHGINDLSPDEKAPLYYVISRFYHRLIKFKDYRKFYDDLARTSKKENQIIYYIDLDQGLYFYILQGREKLTDLPPYQPLRGKTLSEIYGYQGDDRRMDDVDSEGTRQTLIIHRSALNSRITGQYNKLYHEFGHLVHLSLMTEKEFHHLEMLYKAALKNHQTLDDYAAQNATEYFAQGLEAYLSVEKLGVSGEYYRHSKSDLLKKDPDLYRFIESLF
jgi:hypothetical protein